MISIFLFASIKKITIAGERLTVLLQGTRVMQILIFLIVIFYGCTTQQKSQPKIAEKSELSSLARIFYLLPIIY